MLNAAQEEELVGVQKKAVMAHRAADMATVKDPAERFGQGVRGVDRAGDMLQNNVALVHFSEWQNVGCRYAWSGPWVLRHSP